MWWLHSPVLRSWSYRALLTLLCSGTMVLTSPTVSTAQQAKTPPLTQLELQSALMSFADRFFEFMGQAGMDPAIRAKPDLMGNHAVTIYSAFTIAASPNPGVGLLDLVVLTTLGRMIYEEHWRKRLGTVVQPTVTALRTLEQDIWTIAAKVLTSTEQRDLRALISTWRRTHPQQVAFAFVRFSDFAGERQAFTLAQTTKARGLFKAVKEATQKVDAVTLLAERGLYLGTRMPLLAGPMGEVWLSQWLVRPELTQLRGNITQATDAVDRAVKQVERLPGVVEKERRAAIKQVMDRVTVERTAAIDQLMDRVSTERQQLMQELASDETGERGVLLEMQQTLVAGNALATTAQGVLQAFDTFTTKAHKRVVAAGKEATDVRDITVLVTEASQATQHLQELAATLEQILVSPGWEQRLAQLIQVLDRTTTEGAELIDSTLDQTLVSGLIILVAFLVGIAAVGFLLIRYASRRFAQGSAAPGGV